MRSIYIVSAIFASALTLASTTSAVPASAGTLIDAESASTPRFGWDPIDAGYYPGSPPPVSGPKQETFNLRQQADVPNFNDPIGFCEALSDDITCRIDKTDTKSSTLTVSAGFDVGALKSSLSHAWTQTRAYTVSCTSPAMKTGDRFYAYPIGLRSDFDVKLTYASGQVLHGKGQAFEVNTPGVACMQVSPAQGRALQEGLDSSTTTLISESDLEAPFAVSHDARYRIDGDFDCSLEYKVTTVWSEIYNGGPVNATCEPGRGILTDQMSTAKKSQMGLFVNGKEFMFGAQDRTEYLEPGQDPWNV